jgi:integrase
MAQKNVLTKADHFDYQDFEAFINCLHNDKLYIWELYARLSFCTACRASDVRNLRWKDILDKDKVVITEQKTGKTREIVFNSSVIKKFRELYLLLDMPDIEAYIFASNHSEAPMTIQYINRTLKEFKKKYGLRIDHFSTHTFRKTFGRYVYEKMNRSAEALMLLNRILKHSNIEVTKAYIGITDEEIGSVFQSICF